MKVTFDFAEWLKQEMTSVAAVGGGSTSTADIAGFARPLFSGELVRRKMPRILNAVEERKNSTKLGAWMS